MAILKKEKMAFDMIRLFICSFPKECSFHKTISQPLEICNFNAWHYLWFILQKYDTSLECHSWNNIHRASWSVLSLCKLKSLCSCKYFQSRTESWWKSWGRKKSHNLWKWIKNRIILAKIIKNLNDQEKNI